MLAWIQITRPLNGFIAGISVFLGALCTDIPLNITPMWYCFVTMSLLAMAGNVHNDICDIEVDKINQPQRPLPSQTLSVLGAWFLTLNLTGYSLLFAWLIGPLHFWSCSFMVIWLYLYNRYLKGWPLLGNLSISFLCALAILYPTLGVAELPEPLLGALFFAFLFTLIREMLKDLEDMEGDRKLGLKTLAIVLPHPINFIIPYALWWILLLGMPLSYFFGVYRESFFLTSSIFVLLPSIVVFLRFSSPKIENWRKQQKWMKWMMLGGMFSITVDLIWPIN